MDFYFIAYELLLYNINFSLKNHQKYGNIRFPVRIYSDN